MFCEYEIHLNFHTYQTNQTDIIKQWQLIMVSLQLKPDIILGFRWNHVIGKCNHWNNIEATSEQLEMVFIKHYAPNICLSPNMAKFAVS